MTRATLLHVLDRPTALGPAEVRELEQLAQAFPYCQTAHLLLAKAAHDQGTMLAGQRLRRAATYAADRTLLRRLIESVEPVAEPEPEPAPVAAPAALSEVPTTAAAPLLPEPVEIAALVPVPAVVSELVLTVAPVTEAPAIEIAPAPVAQLEITPPPVVEVAPPTAESEPVTTVVALPTTQIAESIDADSQPIDAVEVSLEAPTAQAPIIATPVPAVAPEAITAEALPLPIVQEPAQTANATEASQSEIVELPHLVDQEGATIETIALPAKVVHEEELVDAPTAEEDDLPAQAPAIRPPVEVGEARFEFGLAEPPPPVVPTYELPGLVDEWAASAVTRSLGSPDVLFPEAVEPPAPAFTPAAFTGDTAVGYSFGESSRLGLSMQLLDMLAAQVGAAEATTAVVAAAQPPAAALPPVGTFFEPDPLLLDHWATHRPLPPALPSSLDLINNFLKRQPRLTRPAMLPPAPGGQTDLSVRSTRAEPDLVSENLARIFVRQGKIARAVEIYEKLMVKQPEKMAYFAAQIQSLQPSA
ncbi:hypothetical protein [Hymenobacter negativus]|uniref:Tetratricopeptide repeat protein n=1 Tax=Hymenobacter negativus TaxID=2795026 RepID=A0ABS3Q8E4_9BACT|nr:hypothetical protein [Hymenobacter negativus]MBO2007515.1 hypothetical protein [Hymenobacter negativus]